MYPKNASSPPPIAVGAIYSTVDGSLVTTGASVRVKTGTGSWAAGANSPVCDTTSGTWVYTPSQGETNASSFMIAIYAASATQAVVTVVTTVSDTAGYAGLDWGLVRQATATLALTGTTISSTQAVASVSGAVGSVTGAVASVTGSVGSISGVSFPANFSFLGITSAGYISRVVLVDTTTANSDMRGTDGAALATYWTQQRAGYLDSVILADDNNRVVKVNGAKHVAADVHETQPGSIHTATFDAGAITAAVLASDAITAAKVAADVGTEIATAVRTELATELGRIDATVSSRSTLAQADIRTATGLASANLDSQLSAIKGDTGAILDDTGTSGVKLAADAITSTVLASSAVTEIAQGVDTVLTASHGGGSWSSGGGGSGAYTLTVTVTDGTNPLQNAVVRVAEGVTSLTQTTNSSGVATFAVDAATWAVAITKSGYSFTPTTLAVSGNASQSYAMTLVVIPSPPSPATSSVQVTCYNELTAIEPGAKLYVRQTGIPAASTDIAYDGTEKEYTADSLGVVTLTLWRNATYQIRRGTSKQSSSFTPTTATYSISSILGSP